MSKTKELQIAMQEAEYLAIQGLYFASNKRKDKSNGNVCHCKCKGCTIKAKGK